MRRVLTAVAALAILATACGNSESTSSGSSQDNGGGDKNVTVDQPGVTDTGPLS